MSKRPVLLLFNRTANDLDITVSDNKVVTIGDKIAAIQTMAAIGLFRL